MGCPGRRPGPTGGARKRSVGEPRPPHLSLDRARAVASHERRRLAAARLLRKRLPHTGGALLGSPGSRDRMGFDEHCKYPALRGRTGQRAFADRVGWTLGAPIRRRSDHDGRTVVSTAVCLAPARTIAYPQGGGHLWVYLQWALGLRALGCRVIWLEGIDPREPEQNHRQKVMTLKSRLEPYGLADSVALFSLSDEPLPPDVAELALDLDAAAEADLLLNLWHSLPASVVSRFRRSAFVDTDPGLLQIWMARGDVRVAPHDIYFTIG